MKDLFKNVYKPANDKLLHFMYGTLGAFVIAFGVELLSLSLLLIPIGVTIPAVVKELHDKYLKKTFISIPDILYTIASGFILYLLLILYI